VIGNWYHRAACRLIDPDTMHPMTNERGIGKAKGVCARCEVIRECLAYALDHDERHGIWAGSQRTSEAIYGVTRAQDHEQRVNGAF
jgi:WhiB family redox-sensing transcriptional regulator